MSDTTQTSMPAAPAHIPARLVFDYDHYLTPGKYAVPQFGIAEMLHHSAPPIFYTPRNGGHWVVTRAAEAREMLGQPDKFSSDMEFLPHRAATNTLPLLPINLDPPAHTDARKILMPLFSPGSVAQMREQIRTIASDYIDSVIDRGECEFVSQIAHQFPVNIFMMLVNGPQSDRDLLVDMAERYMHSPKAEDRAKGFQDLVNYLTSFIEQRRKTPGEDLVSLILKGQILGKPLTDDELAGCVILVFLAGLDTVAAMLTFITQYLARHPDKYKELVDDPNRIPNVIEELIRVSGVAVIERGVRNDIDYNGIPFRKFDRITFVTPLAGLDDKDVKDPTNVDFNRTVSRHMAFGWGPHHCIGSHLARVEIRTFLEEWTKRIPKFSVRKDAHISVAGGSSWVPNQLPLIWERVRVPA